MTHGDGSIRMEALGVFLRKVGALAEFENETRLATWLGDMGMTGVRKLANSCPLHRYLTERLAVYGSVISGISVGRHALILTFRPEADGWVHDRLILDTPPLLAQFVTSFDDGLFPNLDTPVIDAATTSEAGTP